MFGDSSLDERTSDNTQQNCAPRACSLDEAELLERLDGDAELLHRLCAIYEQDRPRLMTQLRDAVAALDIGKVSFAAHRVGGLARNLGGTAAALAAGELERMARRSDLGGASAVCELLDRQLDGLTLSLQQLRARIPRS